MGGRSTCSENRCSCSHGRGIRGLTGGHVCPENGGVSCDKDSCNEGYHIEKDSTITDPKSGELITFYKCVMNECTCDPEKGDPARGSNCKKHNSPGCYRLTKVIIKKQKNLKV